MTKYLMLCSVGTSFFQQKWEQNEKDKANELLQILENQAPMKGRSREAINALLSALLTGDSKEIWERIHAADEHDERQYDDWKSLQYPTAELQSTLKWLARKAETGEPLEIEFILYPSKSENSRLTAEIFRFFAPPPFQDVPARKSGYR